MLLRYGGLGVGAFVLLMAIEIASEEDAIAWGELLGDGLEKALIVASATGVSLMTTRFQAQRDEKERLTRDLEIARAEGETWRDQAQTYVAGLGEEISKQFEVWSLTGAEREVGLLMLKGFAHGEIAGFRGTSEATVRHQARSVYQKSGLPGRAAFCAYFLEDLLPGQTGPVPPARGPANTSS